MLAAIKKELRETDKWTGQEAKATINGLSTTQQKVKSYPVELLIIPSQTIKIELINQDTILVSDKRDLIQVKDLFLRANIEFQPNIHFVVRIMRIESGVSPGFAANFNPSVISIIAVVD